MCDGKAIEARLTSLVRRIFAQYQRQLEPEYVCQLDEAIHICKTYRQGVRDFTEEQRTMWVLKPASWLVVAGWDAEKNGY